MRKERIHPNPQNFKSYVVKSGFCRLPNVAFKLPDVLGISWKSSFITLLAYVYAKSRDGEARFTQRELSRVLGYSSRDTANNFIKEINSLFEVIRDRAQEEGLFLRGGELLTRRGWEGGTVVYLVDQILLAESFRFLEPSGGYFAFFNVSLLLPISVQAKALLLFFNHKARGGSLHSGEAVAETTTREIAEVLRLSGGGRLKGYIEELLRAGVVERIPGVRLKFRLCSLREWNKEVLQQVWSEWSSHPFLKDWNWRNVAEGRTNVAEGRTNVAEGRTNVAEGRTNVAEGRTKEYYKNTNTNTNSNRKTNKNTLDDAIYNKYNNGGGELDNIQTLSNSKREIKEEKSSEVENSPSKSVSKAQREKNRQEGAELGKPNKLAERIDAQEVKKIKQALSRVSEDVKREVRYCGIDVGRLEETYGALKKVYGELWWVPAAMYELLARKEGSGYNRKANYNPVGLLISFALKDRRASFWEFAQRFRAFYGVEVSENNPAGSRNDFLPESARKLFDYLRKTKPATYNIFHNKIASCRCENGQVVFVFTDKTTGELFANLPYLRESLNRFFGEKGWRVEY